jgi:hypothetical protein
LILKINRGYNGVSRELETCDEGGKMISSPCLKGRDLLIGREAVG